jgi:Tfp pilus assembly protein PilF
MRIKLFSNFQLIADRLLMSQKWISITLACLFALGLAGCVKDRPVHVPPPEVEQVEPEQPPEADPRTVASLQLTEQGRRLLEAGKSDQAIRVLEQAVSLDPDNGQNYYYLAEAWLMKGVASEAKEFNELAEIHLKEDNAWMKRVARQANRIVELEK